MIKARLVANIPENRFSSVAGRVPKIGDVIIIDQGFTFPDGKAGCLVYFHEQNGNLEYEAEVYETEVGENINT